MDKTKSWHIDHRVLNSGMFIGGIGGPLRGRQSAKPQSFDAHSAHEAVWVDDQAPARSAGVDASQGGCESLGGGMELLLEGRIDIGRGIFVVVLVVVLVVMY